MARNIEKLIKKHNERKLSRQITDDKQWKTAKAVAIAKEAAEEAAELARLEKIKKHNEMIIEELNELALF